jgi:hypothetical protein
MEILPTNALNLVLCPARVCFWTGMIFKTSSLSVGPMKKSTISNSYQNKKKRLTLYNTVGNGVLQHKIKIHVTNVGVKGQTHVICLITN